MSTIRGRTLTADTVAPPNPPSGFYFYTCSQVSTAVSAANALGVGTLRLAPWLVTRAISISRLVGEVTTVGDVGSKFRIGLYADTGSAQPGGLLLDAGQIAGDSATVQELTVAITLQPGLYWVGGAVQAVTTTQPIMRVINSNWEPPVHVPTSSSTTLVSLNGSAFGSNMTGVIGALPSTFASTGVTANIPRIGARVA